MSRVFSEFGIKLVPMKLGDFKSIRMREHQFIIASVRDIRSFVNYNKLLKRYLNYMLRQGSVTLFEFSSFSIVHDDSILKTKRVFQERLPVSMFRMADLIGQNMFSKLVTNSSRWPGGRRAKLPEY
ncbi:MULTISPECIES: hypothetical protein [Halobacteriovorax]|uniref:Uncharacterized protein n=2 Tax=Halobacteriovorax TaxID=1652133 RepID=A0ABY0IGN9_9BACT|nr:MULTISPECIES: hypothetical protein [Halobacteriovorax]AYF43323.1 hypothetical protein BALOs_0308 [Halobacteriovorax sp. BALOs_7]RZF22103.1 hypothetical protein DAY19_10500 [Halobacteriovorax vibrionivorans]TGD46936.1 hypothetical protein EP118_09905 [Halobacteriovorax sp. Y22]